MFKCDKPEPKSWDELWKSGDVDRNMDAMQNTQKQVRPLCSLPDASLPLDKLSWLTLLSFSLSLSRSVCQVGLKSPIRFLKLRLDSGYEEFVAVYEVRIEGRSD